MSTQCAELDTPTDWDRPRWVKILSRILAGCATEAQRDAHLVDDDDVPFGLLDRADAPPPPADGSAAEERTIYLVNEDDFLVPVLRSAPRRDMNSIVDALSGDLTEAELGLGLRTLLDSDGETPFVIDVTVARGIAAADLAPAFLELDGETQILALAQLVLTLTAQPGVGQVAMTTNGVPVDVPRADGTTTSEPVATIDYSELIVP